ncbi:DNA-binding response regulator [Tannerella forsythia]|uniref:DNA-binding response regulator n=2 Tax=Tannerella forsythia TaxID=28112 RepID=A0A3P1XNN9_TANFO|nr:DNA-binding response regulator [Tannerella forsythia]
MKTEKPSAPVSSCMYHISTNTCKKKSKQFICNKLQTTEYPFLMTNRPSLYSCIIVEDEELPRLSLKAKLETYHPDIRILDMCADGDTALESILRHKPQLLFLDIQLPGKDSLWLLEQLQTALPQMPRIIFTTAFTDSKYLLKAIKFSAVDYLNKPVNIAELASAVEKAKKRIREEESAKNHPEKEVYTFRTLHSRLILSEADIVYIQADGNYAQIKLLQGKDELIFERLGEIEKKLDPEIFIRVSRSLIINRNYVRKLNTKEPSCTLVTPIESYTVSIPKGACEELRDKLL